ncbi:MAG TPA: glycoside hydrolase family 15 protein [Candidatus Udaeobacter sp.]|jgi:GH15 family glucan-1,4-alpha-glucosidase|nr:glycoside hydrolase family 15 protein [Candidatus Udaeobacter sp.]
MKKSSNHEYAIKDYALIGNCETAALINPDGGIDWLCLPAFDSPSFFGALLDREKGGQFLIRPACSYRVEREYIENSAILQSDFVTEKGTVQLTEFFVIARQRNARFYDFTSLHPTRKLVRIVKLKSGHSVPIQATLNARADYGRHHVAWTRISNDPPQYSCPAATFYANFPVENAADQLTSCFLADTSQTYFTVLDYGTEHRPPDLEEVNSWFLVTKSYWREWNLFNYYRGAYEKTIRRSAVTLKLLTHASSGAFVAAPTTSLPERIGGDQNWDYRYLWVRDTSLFINTMFRLGYSGEAKAFINFMKSRCQEEYETNIASSEKAKALKVLYPIQPGSPTEERFLEHLRGYRGSTPVRIGNRAARQFQLDNYGHLLEAFYYFRHTGGKLSPEIMELLRRLTEDVVLYWREPDNGIWENPATKHYIYSKIMAWAALERAATLDPAQSNRLKEISVGIREDIFTRGLAKSGSGRFLADAYDSKGIDASCLLAFTNGFLPKNLAVATRQEIERTLVSGPFVYRNVQQREKHKEGAFLLCSFWWISHLIQGGELRRAEEILSQILDHASPLGLFAEEIDPESGEFLGNFPQAFSHLGLIKTILDLEQSKKDPRYQLLPDAQKFEHSVGATIGVKGVLSGFMRVPETFQLLFSDRSKWTLP